MSVVSSPSRLTRLTAPSAKSAPLLSVVIVNFCQWENTLRLSRQLAESISHANGSAEVMVIDNGSLETPAFAELASSGTCQIHQFRDNLGFARAVNEAGLRTTGEWILLLNPDTSLPAGFLDNLSALCRTIADENSRIGVVGLGLRHADGSPQASSGPIPTFFKTLSGLLTPRRIRKCKLPSNHIERTSVEWVTGCGMLIRRDCWQSLNGFDPDFFLYYEDVDFCKRATATGWDVTYEPTISLSHLHPLHTRKVPPALRLMTRHALLNFAFKYWPRWQAKSLAMIVWMEAIARGLFTRIKGGSAEGHQVLRQLANDWWRNDFVSASKRVTHTANTLQTIMADESQLV